MMLKSMMGRTLILAVAVGALASKMAPESHAVGAVLMMTSGGLFYCAPEVVEGNLKATDRVLGALAAREEFASAPEFKAEIKRISAIEDAGKKTAQYLRAAGVNPDNRDEVAQFVGAREIDAKYMLHMERTWKLSEKQSRAVVDAMTTALKGDAN